MPVDEMVERYGTFERMLEFHHIDPVTKHKDYNNLIRRNITSEQIEEIDKCVLLCKQCHGIIHAQNIKGTLKISKKIDNRIVSQKFNGWFIADKMDKLLTFITNEKYLLEPCVVIIGKTEQVLCVLEIDSTYLEDLLQNISVYKVIEVFSLVDDRLLLRIEPIAEKKIKVTQSLGTSIFSLDFEVFNSETSFIWIRNGIMLTKEGEIRTNGEITITVNL